MRAARGFASSVGNLIVGLAILAAVLVALWGGVFVFVKIGGAVIDYFSPPSKYNPNPEVCYVYQGPNGLEDVRGYRQSEPRGAVEVPCNS